MYHQYAQPIRHEGKHKERRVTVTGSGEIVVTPNIVTIDLGVVTRDEQVIVAEQENALIMTNVMKALKEIGIDQSDLHTIAFDLLPRYDYIDQQQQFIGYEVSNIIQVTITDFAQVGEVIDTAVSAGVNQIGMLTFTHDDLKGLEQEVLELSIINAHHKALAVTKPLHVQLQPTPIKIFEQQNNASIPQPYTLSSISTQTPIQAGEIQVTTTIRATYIY